MRTKRAVYYNNFYKAIGCGGFMEYYRLSLLRNKKGGAEYEYFYIQFSSAGAGAKIILENKDPRTLKSNLEKITKKDMTRIINNSGRDDAG